MLFRRTSTTVWVPLFLLACFLGELATYSSSILLLRTSRSSALADELLPPEDIIVGITGYFLIFIYLQLNNYVI